MQTPRDFKAEFKQLLRQTIAPALLTAGFTPKGQQSFRRQVGEVFQVLVFEGNRRNGPGTFSFAGNLSFMHVTPATQADFWCDDPTTWIAGGRMGYLTHGRDHWYHLEDHGPEALAEILAHDLTEIVLPRLANVLCADKAVAVVQSRPPVSIEPG